MALITSISCNFPGGDLSIKIVTENVQVARDVCKTVTTLGEVTRDVCKIAGTLGALYFGYKVLRPLIESAINNGLGGGGGNQEIRDIERGSLRVLLHCFTDERFVEVLADYESGRMKERLQEEFSQVGIEVEGLKVEIENMVEVNETTKAINKRSQINKDFCEYMKNIVINDGESDIQKNVQSGGTTLQDMEANAEDEGEVAFELAGRSLAIEIYIKAHTTRTGSDGLKIHYDSFQGLASKLGISLPDQPPEETTAEPEMETFLKNQINYVVKSLCRHKTQYIREMYVTGQYVEWLTVFIDKSKDHNEENVGAMQLRLQSCIKDLQRQAKKLGIDIHEKLTKAAKEAEQLEDVEVHELRLQIKKLLCKAKRAEPKRSELNANLKRSEIDPTRIITNEDWTISLVRLPDSRANEHVFLVLEGKTDNKSMIWFADFVASDAHALFLPGKVRMDCYMLEEVAGSSDKMLFRCRKALMSIRRGDRLFHSTWHIPQNTAEKLIQNIRTWQNNPPKYNILGNSALAACLAILSGNPTGHNSFTFARMMLHDLNNKYIEIPEVNLDKWLFSATSRYLVDKQFNNRSWNGLWFGLFMCLTGIVTAYLILNLSAL